MPDNSFIVLGGGCFWCLEAIFQRLPGVLSVTSGYAGGKPEMKNPTYREVCGGRTGHAEVIKIQFDPNQTNERQILDLFWRAHDPTTLNRQGADRGTQYRSIILPANDEQKQIAQESKAAAQEHFTDPIVTEIQPLEEFYPAEEYHQDYYNTNPNGQYCTYVIDPKLQKLGMA
jgi:peptide-methionine (S)-S-oxide reductase